MSFGPEGEAFFCDVCKDDSTRCNQWDCPGRDHPDDPHTQAKEAAMTTPQDDDAAELEKLKQDVYSRIRPGIGGPLCDSQRYDDYATVDKLIYAAKRAALTSRRPHVPGMTEDRFARNPEPGECKCGLRKLQRGVDGVNWYWQRHTRLECTVELPNEQCWCGLLRSEHVKGHRDDAVPPSLRTATSTEPLEREGK